MSSPKILVQIIIVGSQIFGKALLEAGRQAIKNAKHTPHGSLGNDAIGVGNATSGSITDTLTRSHRMTLGEAHSILHIRPGEEGIESVLRKYEHLFKANSPPPPPEAVSPAPSGRQAVPPFHSHYLQSKVVRARERIEAELKVASDGSTDPQPPPPGTNGGNASRS